MKTDAQKRRAARRAKWAKKGLHLDKTPGTHGMCSGAYTSEKRTPANIIAGGLPSLGKKR